MISFRRVETFEFHGEIKSRIRSRVYGIRMRRRNERFAKSPSRFTSAVRRRFRWIFRILHRGTSSRGTSLIRKRGETLARTSWILRGDFAPRDATGKILDFMKHRRRCQQRWTRKCERRKCVPAR